MDKNISFGGGGEFDYFPPLSDGAKVSLRVLSAPEKYETLYGEKIRLDVKVLGINAHCDGVVVNKEYTVSSSAMCWKAFHEAWHNPAESIRKVIEEHNKDLEGYREACLKMRWSLTAKELHNGRTQYRFQAVAESE